MRHQVLTFVFYLSLAVAWLLLRGSLTPFPPAVDMALAFVVCAAGFAAWGMAWRSTHPPARPRSGRLAFNWRQLILWMLLCGLLLALFTGPLPWAAQKITILRGIGGEKGQETERPMNGPSSLPTSAAEGPEQEGKTSGLGETLPLSSNAPERSPLGAMASAVNKLPRHRLIWLCAALIILLAALAWLLARTFAARSNTTGLLASASDKTPLPPYLREFLKLCRRFGLSPEPGNTLRELISALTKSGCRAEVLEPVALYHYGICYENVPPQRTKERDLRRVLKVLRRQRMPAENARPV
ncbi:MAG: hypothetical protein ACR2OZ_07100 [Verrucomicrobiales bacterium]